LIDIDPELGTGEADRLEVLGALVEAYETKHYKVSEIA
jgi:antitoxin component HigA of HigAB toxin-antitoxin module